MAVNGQRGGSAGWGQSGGAVGRPEEGQAWGNEPPPGAAPTLTAAASLRLDFLSHPP